MSPTLWLHEQPAFSYPGGERQVRLPADRHEWIKREGSATVLARLRTPQDIVDLALLRDALGFHTKSKLVIPYLPYARADREFVKGDCCGLAAFARLLFAMSWDEIVTLDVHSARAHEYIDRLREISPRPYIVSSIIDFGRRHRVRKISVLLPDDGAAARYKIPEVIGSNVEIFEIEQFTCSKKRDSSTGTLSGFDVPELPNQPAIIVDDICDGGGTFLGIADKIPTNIPLALYTTHSIYSKGTDILKRFALYATNSFAPSYPAEVTVLGCWNDMIKESGALAQ